MDRLPAPRRRLSECIDRLRRVFLATVFEGLVCGPAMEIRSSDLALRAQEFKILILSLDDGVIVEGSKFAWAVQQQGTGIRIRGWF